MSKRTSNKVMKAIEEELEDLATLKDKKVGLESKRDDIRKNLENIKKYEAVLIEKNRVEEANAISNQYNAYASFGEEFNASYTQMRTYLKEVQVKLKEYETAKQGWKNYMKTMEEVLKKMNHHSLSILNHVQQPPISIKKGGQSKKQLKK